MAVHGDRNAMPNPPVRHDVAQLVLGHVAEVGLHGARHAHDAGGGEPAALADVELAQRAQAPHRGQKRGVVELGALIAGPSCGKYLADHGAEAERRRHASQTRHNNNSGARRGRRAR